MSITPGNRKNVSATYNSVTNTWSQLAWFCLFQAEGELVLEAILTVSQQWQVRNYTVWQSDDKCKSLSYDTRKRIALTINLRYVAELESVQSRFKFSIYLSIIFLQCKVVSQAHVCAIGRFLAQLYPSNLINAIPRMLTLLKRKWGALL